MKIKNRKTKISTENEQEKQETPIDEKSISVLTWNKYDFVPGTEIIFEDNQEGEQNGEFPSKWDLVKEISKMQVLMVKMLFITLNAI